MYSFYYIILLRSIGTSTLKNNPLYFKKIITLVAKQFCSIISPNYFNSFVKLILNQCKKCLITTNASDLKLKRYIQILRVKSSTMVKNFFIIMGKLIVRAPNIHVNKIKSINRFRTTTMKRQFMLVNHRKNYTTFKIYLF